MADAKITALTALTTATDDDILAIVDDPGGTPATKKITRKNLFKGNNFVYNVKDYGCLGDGSTVDTVNFKLACDAAINTGGIIYAPQGTYIVSGIYLGNNVTLKGDGMGVTILKIDPTATTGSVVLRVAPASGVTTTSWAGVEDLTIDGDKDTWGNNSNQKIYGYYMGQTTAGLISDCWMTNVEIKNCKSYAFDIENASYVNLTNCWGHDNGYSSGSGANNACSGFALYGDYITANNCRSWSNAVEGFSVGQDSVTWQGIELIGCRAYSNGRHGVLLTSTGGSIIHSKVIGGEYYSNTQIGISLSTGATYCTVDGASSYSNVLNGISISAASYNTIIGNTLKNNCSGGSSNPELYLTNTSTYNTITGNNILSTNATHAISEQNNTTDYNAITGNSVTSTSTTIVISGLNSQTDNNVGFETNVSKITYNCVISKNETTGVMTAKLSDGTQYTHSTCFATLMTTVLAVVPEPATLLITPSVTPYVMGAVTSNIGINKDIIIHGYGATIKPDTPHTGGGEVFKVTTNQKSYRIFGLTIDLDKKYNIAFGGGTGSFAYAPKLIHVKDCFVNNTNQYGIAITGKPNSTEETTVIVQNTTISTGTLRATQECILTNSVDYLILEDVTCLGNKGTYCSAENIYVSNYKGDASISYADNLVSTIESLHLQGRNIYCENINLKDHTLRLRPYAEVHQAFYFNNAERIEVRGLTSDTSISGKSSVEVEVYDDTTTGSIEQLILHDINIVKGEMSVTNLNNVHGKVNIIDIKNYKLDTFSANKTLFTIADCDVDIINMRSIVGPSTTASDSSVSALRLNATHANIAINEFDIENLYPIPGTKMFHINDDSTSRTVSVNVVKPLANGINSYSTAGTPVITKTLLNPSLYAQGNVTGATTFNRVNGETITATLTGNITVTLTAARATGYNLRLILTQDGTGTRTVTWPSNFKKAGGALVLTATAGAVDIIDMMYDSTNWREKARSLNLS